MTKIYNNRRFPIRSTFIVTALLISILLAACGPAAEDDGVPPQENTSVQQEGEQPEASTATPPGADIGVDPIAPENDAVVEPYPGTDKALLPQVAPYPGPTIEGIQPEPPNTERNLPAAESGTGVVGGILIREIVGEGFIPFAPQKLLLGEIITLDNGEPAYVGSSGESPAAELLPTGIFIFSNIPPGDYNLVVDIGITQFLAGDKFTLEAGQVIDLGQVIIELPD